MGKRNKPNATGRSKGDGQYLKLPYNMINSPAFRRLKGPALKVLMELHTRYNGGNNGKVFLSLDEAKRTLNMGKSTADRGFKELEAKGFIVKTKKGQWYGRMANEWALTTKPKNGMPATNDWRNWRLQKLDPRSPGGT